MRTYNIENNTFNTVEEVVQWLGDNCEYSEDEYDELLDDCYPDYNIGYMTYTASQILQECDPIAYRIGLGEALDSTLESVEHELDQLDDGEDYVFMDYTIECNDINM
jgi:cell division septum initiation protein DivIVA